MSSALDLLVRLDRGGAPLRAQLEEQLRDAVRSGRLAPGVALPSSRSLARELGVSRGVVVDAYAQLGAEGYLIARQGAPTLVSDAASPAADAARQPAAERPPRFDFRPGGPDMALFPRGAWLTSLRRALRDAPDARFDYGDPRGAPELRPGAGHTGRPPDRRRGPVQHSRPRSARGERAGDPSGAGRRGRAAGGPARGAGA
jgi:GntR family transcriptional regulator / MocR family aminotransferase